MPTTSNFGWTTPADTDLVKDGALAIRTLGNGIDTSFLDLKGGTTDQVLAKNSNTDLDFKWVAQDDSNAIQNAIVDAKGDLISATAADTPARLAVGANGTVLTADSTEATGLKWAAPAAGATFAGCALYKSGAQSINNNTATAITFDTENFDSDGYHSTVTDTSRITIPSGKGGKYLFTFTISWASNATGARIIYAFNGTNDNELFSVEPVSAAFNTRHSGSYILDISAGSYLELRAYQSSGGALNVNGTAFETKFACTYLGA